MTMTDPIADMLTRLRNANTAFHDDVIMPSSKVKETKRLSSSSRSLRTASSIETTSRPESSAWSSTALRKSGETSRMRFGAKTRSRRGSARYRDGAHCNDRSGGKVRCPRRSGAQSASVDAVAGLRTCSAGASRTDRSLNERSAPER